MKDEKLAPYIEMRLRVALESSVGYYQEWKEFEERGGRVTGARKKINAARRRIERIQAAFDKFDWATRYALASYVGGKKLPRVPLLKRRIPDEMTILNAMIVDTYYTLTRLKQAMERYSIENAPVKTGGRRRLRARDLLTVGIADCLDQTIPGVVSISADEGGLYEEILRISMNAV